MRHPTHKRLSLRYYSAEKEMVLTHSVLADISLIQLSDADILEYETGRLKREFGAALVDFLDIKVRVEDFSWISEDEEIENGNSPGAGSSEESGSDDSESFR